MLRRTARIAAVLGVGVALVFGPGPLWAGATKVPLVDACLHIDVAFCENGGAGGRVSDLPEFMSGFVIYNEPAGRFGMVTLMVRGSLPDTVHSVFRCPGTVNGGIGGGGYSGCSALGAFMTNIDGEGAFHANLDMTVTDTVIAINVPGFATVLANPPGAPIQ
jgi:hypothetical protein